MYKASALRKEIEKILRRYGANDFRKNSLMDEDYDNNLLLSVDYALKQLDKDERRIIDNDFIEKVDKNWWRSYYSKSTYYRLKVRAMEHFLDCLNK